ncbi:MAG: crotonase/enoyl-CoA hydratase family protein [Oleiphilaceae bacterium]|nr:crotonase/enoyl-CoA hydratase family protein [Oleiphilaceae bacterium]
MTERFHDRVTLNIKDDIAYITLSRPDKLNALDFAMFQGITAAAKKLQKNKKVRAVILQGEGRAFCSGLDVKNMLSNPVAAIKLLIKPGRKASNLAQDVSILWRELPIPVIAVTHGKCWGGGFQIALGADFRYSSPDCEFSIMEAKWGLIPDMGGSVALRELGRIDVVKELAMTARVIDATTAHQLGLVTHVYEDPLKEAVTFAESIKQRSPDAIAATKTLFNSSWISTIRQALNWETKLQRKLIGRYNQRTAVIRSRGIKEAPDYKVRS